MYITRKDVFSLVVMSALVATGCVRVGSGARSLGRAERMLEFGPAAVLGDQGPYNINPFGDVTIATDGKQCWLVIMGACPGPLDDTKETDLYVVQSDDNGQAWSAPSLLNRYFELDSSSDHYPKLATDRKGHWVVVWTARLLRTKRTSEPTITMVSRSEDNGETWATPVQLNPAYDREGEDEENDPVLATDGHGTWICAFVQDDYAQDPRWGHNLRRRVVATCASSDNGASWMESDEVFQAGVSGHVGVSETALAANKHGTFVLGWAERRMTSDKNWADRVLTTVSNDSGRTWVKPVVLYDSGAFWLNLAFGNGSSCLAVWEGGHWDEQLNWRREGIMCARSTDSGQSWSVPSCIGPAYSCPTLPCIASDGHERWMAVWQDFAYFGRDCDLFGKASLDDGKTWSETKTLNPEAVSDAPSDGDISPTVASNGHGRWILVWPLGNAGGFCLHYRINDPPHFSWRNVSVDVSVSGDFPL